MSANEFERLENRAQYYRQLANVIRSHASSMKSKEAREELASLASDYESLARYVDSPEPYQP